MDLLKYSKRLDSPTKIKYENSIGSISNNGSICYLNTEPNLPVKKSNTFTTANNEGIDIAKFANEGVTTEVTKSDIKKIPSNNYINHVNSYDFNNESKILNLKNKFSEKMPKPNIYNNKMKLSCSTKNEDLDMKITEKYLKTELNEDKKELNDFNNFKKSEINKIIKFNAERIFQIDEKPRNFTKAKSLGKYIRCY